MQLTATRVTIAMLRKRAQRWVWTPERVGFGWRYVGCQGDEQVIVEAFASIWDDEGVSPSRWLVAPGHGSLESWLMAEESCD